MPCHHNLDEYLVAYLDGCGLRGDRKGWLFRTIGRGTGQLTRTMLPQANAYAMIRRRAAAAGIDTKLGNHSFRATGITAYLKNGGTLEKAAAMANLIEADLVPPAIVKLGRAGRGMGRADSNLTKRNPMIP